MEGVHGRIEMYDPKPNSVWVTRGGRLVVIVELPGHKKGITTCLGLLWYDTIDNTLCVTEVMEQLDYPVHDIPVEIALGKIARGEAENWQIASFKEEEDERIQS
jgi:hypothetical protein